MKRYFLTIAAIFTLCIIIAGEEKGLIIKERKGNEGRRWAVCIGINDYWDKNVADLKKARNDAKGLAKIFETIGQFDKVYTMTDDLDTKNADYPSKFNIESRIDYIMDMANEKDLVVFSFSGHGIADEQGQSYLVSADLRLDRPFDTTVALNYIVSALKKKKIRKSLLLIDACREEMQESKSIKAGSFQENLYSQAEIAAVFYATKAGWFSYEDTKSDYGIFSRFVIAGLEGKADANKDRVVSFSELEKYVMEEVFNYALELDMKQRPYTKIYGEKFGDLALTAIGVTGKEEIKEYKDMVYVEGGTFNMGSNNGNNDEKPVHNVHVGSFYIMKYEVTQKQWKEIMGNNPSQFKGDNLPVECVKWYDAIEFCNKLSEKEGFTPCYTINKNKRDTNNKIEDKYDDPKWVVTCNFLANGYRLPTEAEWEYAAQGGKQSRGYWYSGSNMIDYVMWYNKNSGDKTHPVGTKNPNELGIYDMSGNVWEWCWDWYEEGYYNKSGKENPKGPSSGSRRLIRGGSCNNPERDCTVSCRFYRGPSFPYIYTGFRPLRIE